MIEQLQQFEEISLAEATAVSLMRRHDTKYLIDRRRLTPLLQRMTSAYRVLTIEKKKQLPYLTVYFDTPDLQCYLAHHNKRRSRYKFRSRRYLISDITFNEIKEKRNTGKTYKSRIQRSAMPLFVDNTFQSFIDETIHLEKPLFPTLEVEYNRITLVHKREKERLTIDTDLQFSGAQQNRTLRETVIIERKSERSAHTSHGRTLLKEATAYPTGFSKYCIGVALTYRGIKTNNFKEKLRTVSKIERLSPWKKYSAL
ncbi:polyphosphate polymerase domain-containing protein [Chitinivibrio alkaliphilus]|uniref:VTC domain-containing protein n=1 Tax=Chitinivibrio alkaliphilus ACht1 TaxID=1313304 RepID=U7D496_9BACT|nr:polyphosphate polymerase domain-containing protein [Chitinivibrio alkaliphilus]ERP30788.1 hypothetical protein CALK_2354 [Chitinivibrio alkaliphilus ACht1]